MRKILATTCLALLGATPLLGSAADVDVRVILSGEIAPGVYGRVDFGTAPPPPVLYAKPVVIAPLAGAARQAALPARPAGPREALEQALPALQRLRAAGLLREVGRVRTRLQGQGQEGKIEKGTVPGTVPFS